MKCIRDKARELKLLAAPDADDGFSAYSDAILNNDVKEEVDRMSEDAATPFISFANIAKDALVVHKCAAEACARRARLGWVWGSGIGDRRSFKERAREGFIL